MDNFFSELKRRNVVRVGLAYLVMSWIVMQIVDVVAPTLELPGWFAKGILVLLLAGDDDEGYSRLGNMIKAGWDGRYLESFPLKAFADDSRMIELKRLGMANRSRDRRDILAWLCVPNPPTDAVKIHPESCAELETAAGSGR